MILWYCNYDYFSKKKFLFYGQITEPGRFQFGQMSISVCEGHLEFLSSVLPPGVGFEVTCKIPTVSLIRSMETDLLAGLEQNISLSVNSGSQWIEKVETCLPVNVN